MNHISLFRGGSTEELRREDYQMYSQVHVREREKPKNPSSEGEGLASDQRAQAWLLRGGGFALG